MKVKLHISKESIRRVVRDFDGVADKKLREINIQSYKSANNIRNTAIDLVPVDSGRLKGSIIVQKDTSNTLPTNDGITYLIGTNVEYAKKVEFGSGKKVVSIELTRGYNFTGIQRAKPYLRPAFLKELPLYRSAIKKIWRSR